jgi:hypothetical protein
MKHRRTIFHALVGRYRCHKKRVGAHYTELVFLHPVGSTGYVQHSGAFGARNADASFSCSGGPGSDPTKSAGTHYTELVFLHPVGSTGHVVRSGAFEVRNVDALFFMLEWAWCGSNKNRA